MTKALTLAIAALALIPAQATALSAGTSKGRTCQVSTPATMTAGMADYGVLVNQSSCDPGIRVVKSVIFLTQHGGAVEDSSQREQSGLDHENSKSMMTTGTGHSARHDFTVVLTRGRSQHPERWRKGQAPNACRVATTFFGRDSLVCSVTSPLN